MGRFQGRIPPENPSRQTHPAEDAIVCAPHFPVLLVPFYVPTQAKAQVFLSLPNSNDNDTTSSDPITGSMNVSRLFVESDTPDLRKV